MVVLAWPTICSKSCKWYPGQVSFVSACDRPMFPMPNQDQPSPHDGHHLSQAAPAQKLLPEESIRVFICCTLLSSLNLCLVLPWRRCTQAQQRRKGQALEGCRGAHSPGINHGSGLGLFKGSPSPTARFKCFDSDLWLPNRKKGHLSCFQDVKYDSTALKSQISRDSTWSEHTVAHMSAQCAQNQHPAAPLACTGLH